MRILKQLYVQVLIAVALGIGVGYFWPEFGQGLEPLGKAFVNVIKMVIGPVIFCTVTVGVARMSDLRAFGRVGAKALIYFEVVSTLALLVGVFAAEVMQPGRGFPVDMNNLDPSVAQGYLSKAHQMGVVPFLMGIIPETFVSAFTSGNLLQVLFIAVLTGFALTRLGSFGHKAADGIDAVAKVFFSLIHILVRAAPIGAFGAMAYTVGQYGVKSLANLGFLMATFYVTCILFVVLVLGAVCLWCRFNLFRLLNYIREEIFIVIGASSSEAALPALMEKLQRLGVAKPVVGLVVPTGYSFNLDGINIYMTLATLFLAQAAHIDLSITQIATLMVVSMLTSKGASGVTGAGFITLVITLQTVPTIPVVMVAVLVGIDRFMSECRAIINFIGNAVATVVVARWDNQIDLPTFQRELMLGPGAAERAEAREEEPV